MRRFLTIAHSSLSSIPGHLMAQARSRTLCGVVKRTGSYQILRFPIIHLLIDGTYLYRARCHRPVTPLWNLGQATKQTANGAQGKRWDQEDAFPGIVMQPPFTGLEALWAEIYV